MEEEKHIIKKAVVELYLPSSGNSFEIQNKSLSYFKQYIVPMIEKIIGRLSTGDRIVRIDKLEFDFKNFKYDEPNEAALMKLEQKMEEEIIRLVRAETNDDPRKTAVKKITKAKRDEELFLHLLLNGSLPWWTEAGNPIVLKELAQRIMEQPGPQFINELRKAIASPAVRKRISLQLPFSTVEKIIRVTCMQPEELITIVDTLAAFLPGGIIAPYNFRPVLYRHALRHSQSADVRIAGYVATLIREEMDFSLVEKFYAHALKKGDRGQEKVFFEDQLENTPITAVPEELAFIIKKTLAVNNRYFSGRIKDLFDVKDKKLFFLSADDKKAMNERAAEEEQSLAKRKSGEKKTGAEGSEDEEERDNEPGEENDGHPSGKDKKQARLQKLREERQRREALKGRNKNKQPGEQENDDLHSAEYGDYDEHDEELPGKAKNRSGKDTPGTKDQDKVKAESGKDAPGKHVPPDKRKEQADKPKQTDNIKKHSKEELSGRKDDAFELSRNDDPLELYAADLSEDLLVSNAGIIIITPFLPTFFKALELYDGKAFVSPEAVERAVCLLHYLSTGSADDMQEHDMLLNKIICGMEISEPVALQFELTEKEKEECHGLLEAVAGNWPALKGTSGEGMRDAFFTREGILEKHANGWNLKIERITIDILLDRLTWGISIVKLPWSKEMIFTNW